MYPTTAPLNGPGSSFDLNQDRLRLSSQIKRLDRAIAQLPSVVSPTAVEVVIPSLPPTLQLGLSAAKLVVDGLNATTGPMSVALAPYAENVVDIVSSGHGQTTDFPPGALVPQPVGTYAGSYQVTGSSLRAASALDASTGRTLSSSYAGRFAAQAGGWGPAFLDGSGNGYAVRLTTTGGGLYRTSGGAAYGTAIAFFGPNSGSAPGQHTLGLNLRAVGTSITLTVLVDGGTPLLTFLDTAPVIDPGAVFPAFVCDGGTVYLASWKWYNEGGAPCTGWRVTPSPVGGPLPAPPTGGRRMFVVTTAAAPIDLRVAFTRKTPANRIAHLRQILASLRAAYL